MSFDDRQLVLDGDVILDDIAGPECSDVDESGFDTIPPGDEGSFMSNAGGAEEIMEDLLNPFQSKRWVFHCICFTV